MSGGSRQPSTVLDEPAVDQLLLRALEEDLGAGDITSRALFPAAQAAVGRIHAKESLVVAGLGLVPRLYRHLGGIAVVESREDGAVIERGAVALVVRGDARTLLGGERVALNVLQHLSGIATLTRRCVDALAGTACTLRDTRKTLPGLRLLEKYAVRVGGGTNHRLRLDDGVLIKDNHLALTGGIQRAVEAARAGCAGFEIEVECRTVEEVVEAVQAGADVILLDNMTPAGIAESVAAVRGRARTEASGGITPERVREVAALGVDYIAMGALTHSARAVDLSMTIEPVEPGVAGQPPSE
jgi:nicotinate-nucleotide pyrophosphorylase (carboxylating)